MAPADGGIGGGEGMDAKIARIDERLKAVEKTMARLNNAAWIIVIAMATFFGSQIWGLIIKGSAAAGGAQ